MTPGLTTPTVSHTGQVLSRAVTFQFALDPNLKQRILLTKCAGARRYTMNHHLARVKANLDARSSEREMLPECGDPCEPSTPSLSWAAFSFINEFNAWKNGQSDDSPASEDGSRGLAWRHELPGDVFECA
ncbi:MAG TPA: helix-turn-helix domain-containing protein, partial [Acidimicrobiales bacterium]|nr:helix-turn-helix domain-containing protein [Acidimicrobiales bacterium]